MSGESSAVLMPIRTIVGLILLAMTSFALQDAMVKLISDHISIWQFHLARAVIVIGLISVMVGTVRQMSNIRIVNPGWAALRSVAMSGAFVLFYLAMPFVSLSQAAAAFFTGPLFITLLGALLLGERIGPRRLLALVIGFAGVLVIVEPWGETLELALFLPVGAAFCYAVGIIVTRSRCAEDSAVGLSLVHNMVFAQIGLAAIIIVDLLDAAPASIAAYPFLLQSWSYPELGVWLLIVGTAVTHVIGSVTLTRVYQSAEASQVAPLEYMYLAIVPLLDLLIWQTLPSASTLSGMALIAIAGAFVAWRDGTPVRPRPQAGGEETVEE